MKLSTKGRYGLRAMIDLASHEEEGAVSIASISERQNISESYLEQLVRPLRKAGFIESVRGAGGGYVLAKPADSISVGDVLRVLEGGLEAVTCSVNEAWAAAMRPISASRVLCGRGSMRELRTLWIPSARRAGSAEPAIREKQKQR